MKGSFPALILMVALTGQSAANDLSGPAEAIDGDTITVSNTTVHLAGIAAPPLAQWCRRGNTAIPCGSIARGALLDLVTAVTVTCRLTGRTFAGLPDAVCSAGGFEINANMIYTGWALPLAGTAYGTLIDGARHDRRGLWATDYVRD